MAKRDSTAIARYVLETPDSTVLDVIDELLNKGVLATGDVTLGVAGVDLIYLRLSSILCAADHIWPRHRPRRRTKRRPAGGRK
jgi:gas vesicle structural protein